MPYPYLAWDLFVVKVKDKDLKVGKGTCDYDVMTMMCCVMGRAGQCQIP